MRWITRLESRCQWLTIIFTQIHTHIVWGGYGLPIHKWVWVGYWKVITHLTAHPFIIKPPALASSPNRITSPALVASLEACHGDRSLAGHHAASPHPGFADAGHRTPRLRSRRPLSAAAAPRPSSIRPRRGRAPGFLHPCHAAAPRLAAESHELAHAARLSHAGSLVLSPPPQPRALSRVLPRLASAGSPTRAMNLLRALALLQPEYLICLVDEARSDMSTHWLSIPIGYYPCYLGMDNLDTVD